jgi:hypothetical protein
MSGLNSIVVSLAVTAGFVLACGSGSNSDANDGEGGETGTDSIATSASGGATSSQDDGSDEGTGAMDSGSSGSSTDSDGGDNGALPFTCNGFTAPTGNGGDGVVCFYDVEDPDGDPAASLQLFEVDLDGQPSVYVQLIFAPWFVDNTYGAEAIGWDGHTFKDLDGSDHALIPIGNSGDAEPLLIVKLDYIDGDETAPSGYRALGVWGGEGDMVAGDASLVLAANSSLSRNLNERGYSSYTVDSPATDLDYTPNPAAPDWDYRVVYEAWIDASIFADVNAIDACIDSIHASPAKIGDNTVEVIPKDCPPGWGCFTAGECDECVEGPSDPDSQSTCDPGDGYPPVP